MSKETLIKNYNDYLFIKVEGVRENFQQVIEGSILIADSVHKFQQTNILADYSNVIFKVNMVDAFNLVRLYENKLTIFKKIRLAIKMTESQSEIAGFYEAIAKKRGFRIKIFYNDHEAKSWLVPSGKNVS